MRLEDGILFHNRYLLKKLLGIGGFSEVWLVEDTKVANKKMALKVYAPGKGLDDDGVQLFSSEFQLVYDLNHSHLLRPSHFDDYERSPYLVLPYCENGSTLKLVGKLNEEQAWHFLHDVAAGLAYLHEQNPPIIHQDIKPHNILIDHNGQYLITDFGISTEARSTLHECMFEAETINTTAYTSPERFDKNNNLDEKSDIWSLGATVYELLEGEVPFLDILGGKAQREGAEMRDMKGNWSLELKKIITLCLQKEIEDRPTAQNIVKWTEEYLNGKKIDFTGSKKKKGLIISVIVLMAALFGLGVCLLMKPSTACDFIEPYLKKGEKAAVVSISGNNRMGSVNIYLIDRDQNKNWKNLEKKTQDYSQSRKDSKDSVRTVIGNSLNYKNLTKNTLFLYINDKKNAEDLLFEKQRESLEEWNPKQNYEYLFNALVPAVYRDNSSMLHIENTQISICWLTLNDSIDMFSIQDTDYTLDNKPDKEKLTKIIDQKIPNEKREFFFTSGYGIVGMDKLIVNTFNGDFISVNDIINQLSDSGDMKRVCDIYEAFESAAKTKCFFYRKQVYPEIGYLLYNPK